VKKRTPDERYLGQCGTKLQRSAHALPHRLRPRDRPIGCLSPGAPVMAVLTASLTESGRTPTAMRR